MYAMLAVAVLVALAPAALGRQSHRTPSWADVGECADSGDQSPIDIDVVANFGNSGDKTVDGTVLKPLKTGYNYQSDGSEIPAEFETNEHTWEVVLEDGPEPIVEWQGKKFKLEQFHYHSPSENTVKGQHYDMECHLVHKADDGQVLVLAVFMQVGSQENAYLATIWPEFPEQVGKRPNEKVIPPHENFLPAEKSYYYFNGSFTTPNCDTNVVWMVFKKPVGISMAQRDAYRAGINRVTGNQLTTGNPTGSPAGVTLPWDTSLGQNNRKTQPYGSRQVAFFDTAVEQAPRYDECMFPNIMMQGQQLDKTPSSDDGVCQIRCSNWKDCEFFTFWPPAESQDFDYGFCFLHGAQAEKFPNTNINFSPVSGNMTCIANAGQHQGLQQEAMVSSCSKFQCPAGRSTKYRMFFVGDLVNYECRADCEDTCCEDGDMKGRYITLFLLCVVIVSCCLGGVCVYALRGKDKKKRGVQKPNRSREDTDQRCAVENVPLMTVQPQVTYQQPLQTFQPTTQAFQQVQTFQPGAYR